MRLFLGLLALSIFVFSAGAQQDSSPLLADRSFVQAFESKDKAGAAQLIDAELIWIDATGHRLTRAEVLERLPAVANADVEAPPRTYGETVMMVAHEQRRGGNSYFNTRMWVKRDGRWQMVFSFNTQIERLEVIS